MPSVINTSYQQDYVIVSKTGTSVTLRLQSDTALYRSYWKQFVGANIPVESKTLLIQIDQVPPEVVCVELFQAYSLEYPIVWLKSSDKQINITRYVSVNKPSTQTAGLYKLKYNLAIPQCSTIPLWQSYLSVEQKPVLRNSASTWARSDYTIQNLNRLIVEPQFMEALHEAGTPLYDFMLANENPCLRPSQLASFKNLQVFAVGSDSLFVSGQLPLSTTLIYQGFTISLGSIRYNKYYSSQGTDSWDKETATYNVRETYEAGSVVKYANQAYYALKATSEIPGSSDQWLKGVLYSYTVENQSGYVLPAGPLNVSHVWASVDLQGFVFQVDLLAGLALGSYRGYYARANFTDYSPNDIVSLVSDGVFYLYQRNTTDITQEDTEDAYRPGNYRNPHWTEVYSSYEGSTLREPLLRPYANATDALVAKTHSVSADICEIYAKLLHIPSSITDAIGTKASVLLYTVLVKTRNTYEGLRWALHAVGMDISNLRLGDPSTAVYLDGDSSAEPDVYTAAESLKALASNIQNLRRPGDTTPPVAGDLQYAYSADGVSTEVQQYSGSAWVTKYAFARIEPSQMFNNRYYQAELDYLARVASEALVNLQDGNKWLGIQMFEGSFSKSLSDLLLYEIPIYIYLRLKIYVLETSYIERVGSSMQEIQLAAYCGDKNVLVVYPYSLFNPTSRTFEILKPTVYDCASGEAVTVAATKILADGSSEYDFTSCKYALKIAVADTTGLLIFDNYWLSKTTFGLLGAGTSSSTESGSFVDATQLTDKDLLFFGRGLVGLTAQYHYARLAVAAAQYLRWSYVLGPEGASESWTIGTTAFVVMASIGATLEADYVGSVTSFLSSIKKVQQGSSSLDFSISGSTLQILSLYPSSVQLLDSAGSILGTITVAGSYDYALDSESVAGLVALQVTFGLA